MSAPNKIQLHPAFSKNDRLGTLCEFQRGLVLCVREIERSLMLCVCPFSAVREFCFSFSAVREFYLSFSAVREFERCFSAVHEFDFSFSDVRECSAVRNLF